MKKALTLIFIMGIFYMILEVFFRCLSGVLVEWNGISFWTLAGWTTMHMIPVGGICGYCLGKINEHKKLANLHMILKCLIGVTVILTVEYLAGLIINIWLGLNAWNYSTQFMNLHGQICLLNGSCFLAICPAVFWLDDVLRFYIYNEAKPSTLLTYYKRIFRKN